MRGDPTVATMAKILFQTCLIFYLHFCSIFGNLWNYHKQNIWVESIRFFKKRGENMNIKWILIAISIAIAVGPIGVGLLMYQNNIAALIMPEEPKFIKEAQEFSNITGDTWHYNPTTHTASFSFPNPFSTTLTFNSISADVYCSEHNILVGHMSFSSPTNIPSKSSGLISLVITFTTQGEAHIIAYHGGTLNVDIRNMNINIQGITLRSKEPIEIGTISYP